MSWAAILGFRLVVADLDRATRFYETLGFEPGPRAAIPDAEMALLGLSGGGLRQALSLGPSRLDLDRFDKPGRPYPADADAASLCFQHFALVTSEPEGAWALARGAGAAAVSRAGPVRLPQSAGGVTAVKFRDPDGHPLELLHFPHATDKGWPGQGLRGIDHSAISVSDLTASRHFYEAQGLSEGKASVNEGPTQACLDGLEGVVVDVVPLQPEKGPSHLELLGYRRPQGRFAGPFASNDIAATRLVWQADRTALVRDPDGHLHHLLPS